MRTLPVVLAVLLVAGGLGALSTGAPSASGGSSDEGPLTVSSEQPLDPAGPWVLGAKRVHLSAGGLEVSASTPLIVEASEGPLDRVVVVDPTGRPVVGLGCQAGSCQVRTPLGIHTVPAATLALDDAWHQGQLTGLRLDAGNGVAVVELEAFSSHGVRLQGEGLAAPLTVTSTLVLEGDPRDVDRLAVRGPSGDPVLVVEPGGAAPARLSVAGTPVAVDQVHVRLLGDPLSDPSVTVRLWIGGERVGLRLLETPAGTYQAAGEPLEEHLLLRSPTRAPAAAYRIAAGPVLLTGNGTLSPRFDVQVQVEVPNASAYEGGWLLVDGEPRAPLALSGESADGRVLHGVLPNERLPVAGEHILQARLERDLAPGIVQVQHVDPVSLRLDGEGPKRVQAQPTPDGLSWSASDQADRWEAQARPPEGPWRAAPVDGTQARLPEGPAGAWQMRARGIDAVGNPGPWSAPVTVERDRASTWTGGPPRLTVETPRPGTTVDGLTAVTWDESAAITRVEVSLRQEGKDVWRTVASGTASPLAWESRTVPDGRHTLKVTAIGPGGRVSRLVPVTVDNLAPASLALHPLDQGETGDPARGAHGEAMPGRPLPYAVTTGLVLAGAGIGLVRLSRGLGSAAKGRGK